MFIGWKNMHNRVIELTIRTVTYNCAYILDKAYESTIFHDYPRGVSLGDGSSYYGGRKWDLCIRNG